MCIVTSGRKDPCNDNIGGLKNVYLFSYVKYRRYEITINNNVLVSFPETTIYKYEVFKTDGNILNEDLEEDETGISYNQNLDLVLKQAYNNFFETNRLLGKEVRVITESRQGVFRILGLYNGCLVNKITTLTGGARTDFNGFNITITGKEVNESYFINNLNSSGFIIYGGQETFNLLQEDDFSILKEDGSKILIENNG